MESVDIGVAERISQTLIKRMSSICCTISERVPKFKKQKINFEQYIVFGQNTRQISYYPCCLIVTIFLQRVKCIVPVTCGKHASTDTTKRC